MGSLGSGNHFLEIQVVDKIYDAGRLRCSGCPCRRSAS